MARVALVLSGGGAVGAAHAGVLHALREWGVRPDIHVGTSIGGIVVGALAAGVAIEDQEAYFRDLCAHPTQFEVRVGAAALMGGHHTALFDLSPVIEGLLRHAPHQRVADWPDGFAVVATDLVAGTMATIRRPSALTSAQALQATSALPGLFRGVEVGGRHLVDGGLLDNVPIDVAARMGVDKVIAVRVCGAHGATEGTHTAEGVLRRSLQIALNYAQVQPPAADVFEFAPQPPPGAGLLSLGLFDDLVAAGHRHARERRTAFEEWLTADDD